MSFSTEYLTSLKAHPDYEDALRVKIKADEAVSYDMICVDQPEHKVFYFATDKALMPGHIYSKAGEKEFFMSGLCEYCWDAAFTLDGEEE